jgi:hypothetical protein
LTDVQDLKPTTDVFLGAGTWLDEGALVLKEPDDLLAMPEGIWFHFQGPPCRNHLVAYEYAGASHPLEDERSQRLIQRVLVNPNLVYAKLDRWE